jgi:hypothetical protein
MLLSSLPSLELGGACDGGNASGSIRNGDCGRSGNSSPLLQ